MYLIHPAIFSHFNHRHDSTKKIQSGPIAYPFPHTQFTPHLIKLLEQTSTTWPQQLQKMPNRKKVF